MKHKLILAVLLFAVPVMAVDPGTNAPPPLNVSQYSSMPPGPPPQAEVKITASTQPTEEGKAPPAPDVSVRIPMSNQIFGLPVQAPDLEGKEWTPQNTWNLIVSAAGLVLVIWIGAPLVKDLIRKRLNLGKEPPPPPVA